MEKFENISVISEEMLLASDDPDRVKFVTSIAKLAETDPQMYKLMQLWMYNPDYAIEAQIEIEASMRDYLRRKALWKS